MFNSGHEFVSNLEVYLYECECKVVVCASMVVCVLAWLCVLAWFCVLMIVCMCAAVTIKLHELNMLVYSFSESLYCKYIIECIHFHCTISLNPSSSLFSLYIQFISFIFLCYWFSLYRQSVFFGLFRHGIFTYCCPHFWCSDNHVSCFACL